MFYAGQKVVKTKDGRAIKKGQIVTVLALANCPKCGELHIMTDVPHNMIGGKASCYSCSSNIPEILGAYWIGVAKYYAPIEEYTDSMSIAMQLVQEIDQVDRAKNPIKTPQKV